MAAEDYEIDACKAVGLRHPSDVKQGEIYHNTGTFQIGNAAAAIRAIADKRWNTIGRAAKAEADAMKLKGDEQHTAISGWMDEHGHLSFGNYVDAVRHMASLRKAWDSPNQVNPDALTRELIQVYDGERHTPDEYGYGFYLADIRPQLGKLLKRTAPALIPEADRLMHSYVIGRNGSGKTTLLKTLIHSYATRPNYAGVIVLDPHGDMVQEVGRWREFAGSDRLVFIDPALSAERSPRLNPLELPAGITADQYAQELTNIFEDMLIGSSQGFTPNMRAVLQYTLRILVEEDNTTLLDLLDFLSDGTDARWVAKGRQSSNLVVRRFFESQFTQTRYRQTKEAIANKIDGIIGQEAAQRLFLGPSTVDLEKLLDGRKVVLVNLSKGLIGESASEALGRFIIGRLHGMALRRAREERGQRVPVHVFVDECQNFIGGRIGDMLAEDRKYGLHLTLANQYRTQIERRDVREAVIRNTHVKFVGLSSEDNIVAKELDIAAPELRELERGVFYCRTGEKPSVRVNVRGDLADDRNDMTEAEWRQLVGRQVDQYYAAPSDGGAVALDVVDRPALR